MKHLFVPYELALIAKEKGFNELVIAVYDDYIESEDERVLQSAVNEMGILTGIKSLNLAYSTGVPMYQQLIDWFREKAIRIIEKPEFGWNVMVEYNGGYITYKELFTLDEALEEAFKLI